MGTTAEESSVQGMKERRNARHRDYESASFNPIVTSMRPDKDRLKDSTTDDKGVRARKRKNGETRKKKA